MKKRLLSALLALALVFVLLPTAALADTTPVTDENVKINGTAVIVGNDISLGEGNGTYSYDNVTHTLTLNNATITTTGNIGISFGVPVKGNIDYKIELIGTNTISSTSAQAIYVEYDSGLDQQGTQKLSTLTINGSAGSQLILNASGYEKEAIWSKGDFTLSGGTAVTAFSSGEIAVNVGSMTINNSKLSAQSSSYGTTVVLYGFEMIGDAAEFEALNTSSGVRAVLRTSGASENIDWSKYQLITGSYSGNALTKSEPTVCDKNTLNELFSSSSTTRYIHIAKRTIPALQRTPDVLIAGENAVVGVETSIPSANGSGTYFYDQASKTLTLNNVNITKGINAIQFMANGAYTIKLEGENKISNVSNGISLSDDQYITSLNVTITGTGNLDISAKGLAINMEKGDLKFENTGAIKLATGNIGLNNNALSVKGNITITDMSKYSVTGTQQTGGKPLGSEVSLTEASQLKGGTTGYRIITITPAALEKSNVYVAGTNLYKNTAYTIQNGKPVMGGTYPDNYNIYLDTTGSNYVLYVNNADIKATGNNYGIFGTSNIVFKGTNSITTERYGIYSDFNSSDLNISGTGSLTIKANGSNSAIANSSHTSKSIIISGNDFTVTADASATSWPAIDVVNDLTIKDGVKVVAISNNAKAIMVYGSLTVTNGSLTATSTSDRKPTIEVEGGATLAGSEVKITNNSTRQGTSGENSYGVSTGLYVGGTLDIKNAAKVTSTVIGGNAIYAKGDITISGDSTEVNAQNSAYKFSAISTNKTVNISDNSTVKAENLKRHQGDPTGETDPSTGKTYNACPAITGKIANKNSQNNLHIAGFTTSNAGSQNPTEETPLNLDIAPGSVEPYILHYNVTITRGDKVTRTNSPVVIAGTTLLNDTFYTINGSTVAEGTESNYNAFYSSTTKTLKLNNASINGAGTNKAIEANVGGYTFTIELVGNNIIKTSGFANNVIDITGNLYFTGSGTAEVSGKGTPIYATYKIDVSADVTITNTEKAGSFTFSAYGENSSNYKGANTFAIGTGYTAYATTDKTTWAVYDNTTASENESYTTLRITTQPPETGGGSTHQHTYDQSAWKSDATHHWQECTDPNCPDPTKGITNKASHSFSNGTCTICGYRGQTEEHHFGTEWISDAEYHWHECTDKGCNAISGKAPHEWTGWRIDEPSPGMHNRFCNCGYNDYSHHYNLVYAAAGEAGHYQYCTHGNCTFKTSTVPHKYDGDTCTICNYTKSGEIVPPTPDNPGTIVIIRPAEEEKPAQQPNPSTGANDLVGLAVAAAVAAALGSAALLRKHD